MFNHFKKELLASRTKIFPVLMLTQATVAQAGAEHILIATDLERALHQKGLPIAECVFENSGIRHQIISVPWSRAQLGTKDGIFDGFFAAAKSSKRDSYAILSNPLLHIEWLYVVPIDSRISPHDANFFEKTFAANVGTARYSWLVDQHETGKFSADIIATSNSANSLKMLNAGRIDVNLENKLNLEYEFEVSDFDAADFKTFLATRVPAGIYFGKEFLSRNPGFVSGINAEIEKCRNM